MTFIAMHEKRSDSNKNLIKLQKLPLLETKTINKNKKQRSCLIKPQKLLVLVFETINEVKEQETKFLLKSDSQV